MDYKNKIRVSKLSAARRQLDCAIEMWFTGKDEVSVHTLAGAAHQIIYDISKERGGGRETLFDSIWIKAEHRKELIYLLKRDVNFFKHADRDPDPVGVTEFSPVTTILFLLFAIVGLENLGEQQNDVERTFLLWNQIHHPDWFDESFSRKLLESTTSQKFTALKQTSKHEFFELALEAFAYMRTGRSGPVSPRFR